MPAYRFGYENGYKQGQVAAINGKIEYELIVKEDKTSEWERIDVE
jgi:hypothetical protein